MSIQVFGEVPTGLPLAKPFPQLVPIQSRSMQKTYKNRILRRLFMYYSFQHFQFRGKLVALMLWENF